MPLSLLQFKNHQQTTHHLTPDIQMLVGNNGSGKSTICEAYTILYNAVNPHTTQWSEKSTFGTSGWSLRMLDDAGESVFGSICEPQISRPRWYRGDRSTTRDKYLSELPYRAIWITSDHLRIITSEPTLRREWLDAILCASDRSYEHHLKSYQKAVTERNRVLQSILDGEAKKDDLGPWNHLMIEHGLVLMRERRAYFSWLTNQSLPELHIPGKLMITLHERHPLSELTTQHYEKLIGDYIERDMRAGRTTIGPHLDDIDFEIENRGNVCPVKMLLSRGEIKTVLLYFIRLAGNYLQEKSGKKPLFLLDDVLSELDQNHISILLDLFRGTTTLITTQPNHSDPLLESLPTMKLRDNTESAGLTSKI